MPAPQEQSFEDAFAEFTGGTTTPADERAEGEDDKPQGDAGIGATDEAGNQLDDAGQGGADDADKGDDKGDADDAGQGARPAAAAPAALSYDDLLALVPEDKREAAKALVERGRTAEHKLASESGRQAALQRRLQEERQRAAKLEADLAKAATPAEKAAAQAKVDAANAKIDDTEDVLEKEFPELSKPVTMRIEQVVKRLLPPAQELAAKSEAHDGQQPPSTGAEVDDDKTATYTTGYQAIAEAIPDWQEAVQHAAFQPWLNKLPAGLRALAASEDPQDSIWLVSKFKTDLAEAQRRHRERQQEERGRQGLKDHVAPRKSVGPRTDAAAGATFEDHFNALVKADETKR